MSKILLIMAFLFLPLAFYWGAAGGVNAAGQYEYREVIKVRGLEIDKKVLDPRSGNFVDNLGVTEHLFRAGDEVVFRLSIKNSGDTAFDRVWVDDTLPSFLELTGGSLNFEITNLNPGQKEEREIKTRVVSEERFPHDQSVICDVNVAKVRADKAEDKDAAKVCIARKAAEAKVLPVTGTNLWLILSTSLLGAGVGFALIRVGKS